MTAWCSDVF